jgi:hypothetical protein
VTQHQLHDLRTLLQAFHKGEWVKGRCPRCNFEQLRGHRCSCPVKVAVRNLSRLAGTGPDTSLDDDDLLVEQAMIKIEQLHPEWNGLSDYRAIVREAVDGAVQFGRRATQ